MLCLAKAQHCQGEEEKELKRRPNNNNESTEICCCCLPEKQDLPLSFLTILVSVPRHTQKERFGRKKQMKQDQAEEKKNKRIKKLSLLVSPYMSHQWLYIAKQTRKKAKINSLLGPIGEFVTWEFKLKFAIF